MTLAVYTLIHVILSLIGIAAGFAVLFGFITRRSMPGLTGVFLSTTILTSLTGYGFPVDHIMPSHIVGAISLVVLALAVYALYSRHLQGRWRRVYVVTSAIALYFNVFVGVVQAFQKIPALKAAAPTQTEPAFVAAQLAVLALLAALGTIASMNFRESPPRVA